MAVPPASAFTSVEATAPPRSRPWRGSGLPSLPLTTLAPITTRVARPGTIENYPSTSMFRFRDNGHSYPRASNTSRRNASSSAVGDSSGVRVRPIAAPNDSPTPTSALTPFRAQFRAHRAWFGNHATDRVTRIVRRRGGASPATNPAARTPPPSSSLSPCRLHRPPRPAATTTIGFALAAPPSKRVLWRAGLAVLILRKIVPNRY